AERVFVGRHSGTALADLLLDALVGRGPTCHQLAALIDTGKLRSAFGQIVMAEPALVIINLLATLDAARGAPLELENLERALVMVGRWNIRRGFGNLRFLLLRRWRRGFGGWPSPVPHHPNDHRDQRD